MEALWALLLLIGSWLHGVDDDLGCLVLAGLDATRAAAFVDGDPDQLGDVYVDERAAHADAVVLRSYRERGLRLAGMQMVRLRCRTVETDRDRIVLDVVDRLGPTRVRAPGGEWRDLPVDQPTRRTLVLQRVGEVWRITAVSL